MPGPLANVDTIIGGVINDINRLLYFQDPATSALTMKFLVPDPNEVTNFRELLSIASGFDMETPDEPVGKEGQSVVFNVADVNGTVAPIIRTKDLHIEVNGVVYKVGPVPLVPSNEGQVYELNCKVRNTRAAPFDNTAK